MKTEESFEIDPGNGELVRGWIRDTGSGPIGMYVHGLLSSGDGQKSMHLWESAIRKDRSWARFDQRGQGRSDGSFEQFRISRVFEDLHCMLTHLGERPKILVGSSLGGWISAYAATTGNYNIAGLILIAPAFNFVEAIYDSMSSEEKSQWENDGRYFFGSPYEEDGFGLDFETIQDARPFDIYSNRIEFDHPVAVLHGESDDVVPVDASLEFQRRANSEVSLEIIPGADHRLTDHSDRILALTDEIWLGTGK